MPQGGFSRFFLRVLYSPTALVCLMSVAGALVRRQG